MNGIIMPAPELNESAAAGRTVARSGAPDAGLWRWLPSPRLGARPAIALVSEPPGQSDDTHTGPNLTWE